MNSQGVENLLQEQELEKQKYLKAVNFVMQKILLELNFEEKKELMLREKIDEMQKEIKLRKINEIINKTS